MADEFSVPASSGGFSDFLDAPEPVAFESQPAAHFTPSFEETPGAPFADTASSLPTDSFGSSEPTPSSYSDSGAAAPQGNSSYDNFSDEKRSSAAEGFSQPASNYDLGENFGETKSSSFHGAATYDNFADNPISIYRREHADFIERKDAKAEDARLELLAKARVTQQEFNSARAEKNEKRAAKNREDEKKYITDRDAILEGSNYSNDWERVGALIDVKAPTIGRDTTRLRKLLIELKH